MRRWVVTYLATVLGIGALLMLSSHSTTVHAQTQIPDQAPIFGAGSNASGATTCSSTGGQPIYVGAYPAVTWTLTFYVDGTNFTAASVGVQGAPAATGGVGGTQGAWTSSSGITIVRGSSTAGVANPLPSAAQGTITISTYYPWIRVFCSAATGASGTVYATLSRDLTFFSVPVLPPGTGGDGGITVIKTYWPISQTASSRILSGSAGQKAYIYSWNVVVADAENLAVVEGTTVSTPCDTNTITVPGLSGGTTAAQGWNFSANGGISFGNGGAAVAKTSVYGDDVCLFQSGTGRVSGGFTYAFGL